MSTLFISDLHLDPERPAITALLRDFLRREARGARALFVLGDLFEAWVGDDDDAALAREVGEALREVRDAGTDVAFIRGNRDFLLGADYSARSGMTLLPDPCVVRLAEEPVLLLHGDLLCTDDAKYLAFRHQVRDPAWQAQFLSRPLAARRAFAAQARQASQAAQQAQALEIGDANQDAVAAMLRRYGVRRMIHGHTHRPAVHDFTIDGVPHQRIVLGDWYEQGSVLRLHDGGRYELAAMPLPADA